jgi:hypothetical protein
VNSILELDIVVGGLAKFCVSGTPTFPAIQDWPKAAQFYKDNNSTRDYQIIRGWLKELGANI